MGLVEPRGGEGVEGRGRLTGGWDLPLVDSGRELLRVAEGLAVRTLETAGVCMGAVRGTAGEAVVVRAEETFLPDASSPPPSHDDWFARSNSSNSLFLKNFLRRTFRGAF